MTQNHSAQLLKDVLPAAAPGEAHATSGTGTGAKASGGLSPRALEVAESLQKSVISPSVLSGFVRLADMAIVGTIGVVALTGGFGGDGDAPDPELELEDLGQPDRVRLITIPDARVPRMVRRASGPSFSAGGVP